MTHEHMPEFIYGDELSEDGISTSRRGVLGVPIPRYTPTPAAAPARNEVARPVALVARTPEQPELLLKAQRLFDAMGALLSERISNEELGDALEALQKMVREGQPQWKLQARILSTLLWVSAHSAQDGVHSLLGTETAATGNNGGKSPE